jgi:hypothetical protein
MLNGLANSHNLPVFVFAVIRQQSIARFSDAISPCPSQSPAFSRSLAAAGKLSSAAADSLNTQPFNIATVSLMISFTMFHEAIKSIKFLFICHLRIAKSVVCESHCLDSTKAFSSRLPSNFTSRANRSHFDSLRAANRVHLDRSHFHHFGDFHPRALALERREQSALTRAVSVMLATALLFVLL